MKGVVLPAGEVGNFAVRRPDPVLFLEYFRLPDKTAEKFVGDWCILGDHDYRDRGGYFWFEAEWRRYLLRGCMFRPRSRMPADPRRRAALRRDRPKGC